MKLLNGLHITQIRLTRWPTELNGNGMDRRRVNALAWIPQNGSPDEVGTRAEDEMWRIHTEAERKRVVA